MLEQSTLYTAFQFFTSQQQFLLEFYPSFLQRIWFQCLRLLLALSFLFHKVFQFWLHLVCHILKQIWWQSSRVGSTTSKSNTKLSWSEQSSEKYHLGMKRDDRCTSLLQFEYWWAQASWVSVRCWWPFLGAGRGFLLSSPGQIADQGWRLWRLCLEPYAGHLRDQYNALRELA